MVIVITEWALDSYLDLLQRNVFTKSDYRTVLRPDVLLLRQGLSPPDPKLGNSKFWSPAVDLFGRIPNTFKMKWHNLGPGKVQLRLGVVIEKDQAFLCRAWTKGSSPATNYRQLLVLRRHQEEIQLQNYIQRGTL